MKVQLPLIGMSCYDLIIYTKNEIMIFIVINTHMIISF